uniref:Uncharacterized protein n=1 Tax=Anguilla anguilla TaxID=7936 RepID=A0A0E9PL14_ANGAN
MYTLIPAIFSFVEMHNCCSQVKYHVSEHAETH